MKKHFSIDQLSTATLRQTQSQSAMTRRDINKLRDSISGLSRSIHAPVIRPLRGVIKGSRTNHSPLLFAEAAILTRYAINSYNQSGSSSGDDDDDDDYYSDNSTNKTSSADYRFYKSEGQLAGNTLGRLILGQRIR